MTTLFPAAAFDALGAWAPAPPATDRAAWQHVDPASRAELLAEALRHTGPWPVLTASAYLRYRDDGDRVSYEQPYFARRARLSAVVLAAALTGEERWLADAVDGVSLVCEETSWCLPAHDTFVLRSWRALPDPAQPCLDLFAAETAGLLAFTDLLLGDALDRRAAGLRQRARAEVAGRVLGPFRDRDDWWWFGSTGPVNNWNPWICSNVLAANLLLETDAATRTDTARRVAQALGHFLAGYPEDGGCDEGALYWWRAGGALFDCLDAFYQASDGVLDAFGLRLVRNIARYPLVVHLADRWQVNFGDGSALVPAQTPADLLHRFGRRIGDAEVMAHAVALGAASSAAPGDPALTSLARRVAGLFDEAWRAATPVDFPYPAQNWLPDLQVLTARQHAGSAEGLFLAAKGGHNDESHNHNDVGTFVVGLDGQPILVDVGVGTYTARTFSQERYSIWTMRGAYHNVPEIGGHEQAAGQRHRASSVHASLADGHAELDLDLAAAYPAEAGVLGWRRRLRLDRTTEQVTIVDEWQPGSLAVAWHLITPADVTTTAPGRIDLTVDAHTLVVEYDPACTVTVEDIELTDAKLTGVWGNRLRRIRLSVDGHPMTRHRILLRSAQPRNAEVPA